MKQSLDNVRLTGSLHPQTENSVLSLISQSHLRVAQLPRILQVTLLARNKRQWLSVFRVPA